MLSTTIFYREVQLIQFSPPSNLNPNSAPGHNVVYHCKRRSCFHGITSLQILQTNKSKITLLGFPKFVQCSEWVVLFPSILLIELSKLLDLQVVWREMGLRWGHFHQSCCRKLLWKLYWISKWELLFFTLICCQWSGKQPERKKREINFLFPEEFNFLVMRS